MKILKNENMKSVYDIVVRSKITGKYLRTQCSTYVKQGNLKRFLSKYDDKIEIVVLEPSNVDYIFWDIFVSCL